MTTAFIEVSALPNDSATCVVLIKGDVDELSINDLVHTVHQCDTDPNVRNVIIDLTQVTFMNSKGLGHLIVLHTTMTEKQKRLILAGTNEFVSDLISMVGVMKMIPYYPTVDEAVLAL